MRAALSRLGRLSVCIDLPAPEAAARAAAAALGQRAAHAEAAAASTAAPEAAPPPQRPPYRVRPENQQRENDILDFASRAFESLGREAAGGGAGRDPDAPPLPAEAVAAHDARERRRAAALTNESRKLRAWQARPPGARGGAAAPEPARLPPLAEWVQRNDAALAPFRAFAARLGLDAAAAVAQLHALGRAGVGAMLAGEGGGGAAPAEAALAAWDDALAASGLGLPAAALVRRWPGLLAYAPGAARASLGVTADGRAEVASLGLAEPAPHARLAGLVAAVAAAVGGPEAARAAVLERPSLVLESEDYVERRAHLLLHLRVCGGGRAPRRAAAPRGAAPLPPGAAELAEARRLMAAEPRLLTARADALVANVRVLVRHTASLQDYVALVGARPDALVGRRLAGAAVGVRRALERALPGVDAGDVVRARPALLLHRAGRVGATVRALREAAALSPAWQEELEGLLADAALPPSAELATAAGEAEAEAEAEALAQAQAEDSPLERWLRGGDDAPEAWARGGALRPGGAADARRRRAVSRLSELMLLGPGRAERAHFLAAVAEAEGDPAATSARLRDVLLERWASFVARHPDFSEWQAWRAEQRQAQGKEAQQAGEQQAAADAAP